MCSHYEDILPKHQEIATQTVQKLCIILRKNEALTESMIHRLMTKFKRTDSVATIKSRWQNFS